MGDLLDEPVLRRPRARPGRAGDDVDAAAAADAQHDGRRRPGDGRPWTEAFYADPVRRYMLPVFSDRRTDWPSHPHATRDSLHEHEMWVAEGLTHRYPTKVLAELLPTCPQYCGHCTRMDLVGNSTPAVDKLKFDLKPVDRLRRDDRLPARAPPACATSSSPAATWRTCRCKNLEAFVARLLEIENIRDIRLATKALMGLPQHWLQDDVVAGMERLAHDARARGVHLAIHTHVNAAAVGDAAGRRGRQGDARGRRPRRPQPGRAAARRQRHAEELLDLCFALLDGAGIMPYYFYMCDMIPIAEHWRVSVAEAQELQHEIMGYLPGFATPRIVCDVPVRRQALGAPARRVRPRARHHLLDEELPHRHRGAPTPTRSTAATSTTTRSTRCPRPVRRGGASTARTSTMPSRPVTPRRPPRKVASATLAGRLGRGAPGPRAARRVPR